MSLLYPTFVLYTPNGDLGISQYVSRETDAEVTNSIEKAHEVNAFTAADVTIKGRDPSGTVKALFANITPGTTEWALVIEKGNTIFDGIVLAETVEFNLSEGSFSFTAVSAATILARTRADNLFLRTLGASWTLYAGVEKGQNYLEIAGSGTPAQCDFTTNDILRIEVDESKGEEVKVVRVYPTTQVPPFTSWVVILAEPVKQAAPAGVPVTLQTLYRRNVKMRDVVDGLFQGAGLNATVGSNYEVTDLPNAGLFASPVNPTGLTGPAVEIAPSVTFGNPGAFGSKIWAAVGNQLFQQSTPPDGSWTAIATGIGPPLDPTNYGANVMFYGERRRRERLGTFPREFGPAVRFSWYAYDYRTTTPPFTRWELRLDIDADTPDGLQQYTIELHSWTSTTGANWGSDTLVDTIEAGSTYSDLIGIGEKDGFGAVVIPASGELWFTDFTAASAGAPVTFSLSKKALGSGTVTRALVADVHGHLEFFHNTRLAVWALDGLAAYFPTWWVVETSGTPAAIATGPAEAGWMPQTFKFDSSANRWVMLVQNSDGVRIGHCAFGDAPALGISFATDPIAPPLARTDAASLAMWHDPVTPAGTTWPLYAVIGNQLVYIAEKFTGVIEYVNLEGLSCGDALAQLTILVDGYFTVDAFGRSFFRSRDLPTNYDIGYPSVGEDAIDGDWLLAGARAKPCWPNAPLYVRVENPDDETIVGGYGDTRYVGTDYELTLRSRFVPSASMAGAIAKTTYAYIGQALRVWDGETYDDLRKYQLGYTFKATIDGVQRTFQIISTGIPLWGDTVKVQGIEL